MNDYRVGSIENGNYGIVPSASEGAMMPRPQAPVPMPQESQGRLDQVQNGDNRRALAAVQQKTVLPEQKASPQDAEKATLPLTTMADVILKFKVNEETRNITLYVIDRESKRVLRSIPPEEMNKLQAGDILELLA